MAEGLPQSIGTPLARYVRTSASTNVHAFNKGRHNNRFRDHKYIHRDIDTSSQTSMVTHETSIRLHVCPCTSSLMSTDVAKNLSKRHSTVKDVETMLLQLWTNTYCTCINDTYELHDCGLPVCCHLQSLATLPL